MRYEELTGQIQARAGLPDSQSAERALRATLETLAERIPDGVADHLAAQLPHEAAESLRRVVAVHEASPLHREESRERGERFDLIAFTGRVAWRAEASEEEAIQQATAVLEVLDAAVAPELMNKLSNVLPQDIRALLPSARGGD
ncbi:DUF2267 domain-containing protein [Streptomyces gobiensis]|nr:DUF2267 domain-containing protein [Streptomyces gobiensis]UGY95297.1 DUF2267 domain-containing protein [Streptomyces gobiensis]